MSENTEGFIGQDGGEPLEEINNEPNMMLKLSLDDTGKLLFC